MLKIDDENIIKSKTTVQGKKRTPFVYLIKTFFDNGLDIVPGQELEICQDRKNKIIYFRYGGAE